MAGFCGQCQIQYGDQCVPCPDGTTLPECSGCQSGGLAPEQPWISKREIVSSVVTALITAIVVGYVTQKVLK